MYDLEKELSKLNDKSSINDVQEYINKMLKTRGFEGQSKQEIMLLLTEEIGELAKEVRKSTNMKIDQKESRKDELSDEIADVFIYILSMCTESNIDLLQAFINKENKNMKRVWK